MEIDDKALIRLKNLKARLSGVNKFKMNKMDERAGVCARARLATARSEQYRLDDGAGNSG